MPSSPTEHDLRMVPYVAQRMRPKGHDMVQLNQEGYLNPDKILDSVFHNVPLEEDMVEAESFDDYTEDGGQSEGNTVKSPSCHGCTNKERFKHDKDILVPPSKAVLRFDDDDADVIEYDSDLDWNNQPFDYTVPMDRPFVHEEYNFESAGATASALSFDPQQLVNNAVAGASHVQRRLSQTAQAMAPQLGRVARKGQAVATNVGEYLSAQVKVKGKGLVTASAEVARQGWASAGALVRDNAPSPPAIEGDQADSGAEDGDDGCRLDKNIPV